MANADRIIELLHEAKVRPVGAERARFLDEACGDDAALKAQIISLLEAEAGEGESDFLKIKQILRPPILPTEKPGDRIGRYKLLEQIGEGGCGVVYMAEQEEPVRRRVALKVIKLGMDTKQVIARFEAERQALAMMDHPNIAKVLDGGATETGRPFFVMELVRGIKITDYCDQNNLSTTERLELFMQVCQAIQHAHQKGIIHRDIKPSNILVTQHDDVAVPKVIDFGIAKATVGQLTDKTVFTAFAQFIGTPAYMSPEQAQMGGLDIDTRADIYSLGVLLYELLTGHTPFDAKELLAAGMDEMRRKIREDEPAKPSTRLSTLQALVLTTVAKRRQAEPPKLIHLIRGDLDWLVMKCLEKDRTRRYDTANGLAMDIQRHLANEPVVARPPGKLYRFEKLIRRNPIAFAATGAFGFVLAVVAFFAVQAQHATRARLAERRQNAIDKTLLTAWSGDVEGTEQSIREAEVAGISMGELRMLRGTVAMQRGDYRQAVQELEQAWKLSPQSVAVCSMLMKAHMLLGDWHKTEAMLETLERLKPTTPEDFLFRGSLDAMADPAKSLETLNEAVRRRPTGIARLYRGSALVSLAHDRARIEDIEAAISDVRAVMTLLPTNAEVIVLSLNAHLIACGIYEENRLPEKRAAAWQQAGIDATALEKYPDNQAALIARAMYLKHVSDDWAPLEKLRGGSDSVTNGLIDYFAVLSLYHRGAYQTALEVFDSTRTEVGSHYTRGFILPELPDGPQLAWKEVERLRQLNPSTWDTMAIQLTLCLLGRKDEAVNMCRQARDHAQPAPPWRRDWYRRLLDYSCGDVSETELIKTAGSSRYSQCEAHFFIGMTKLGEGDRKAAQEHFRAAVASRVFMYLDYDWGHAFLARMDKDPNWPAWISAKPE